MIISYVFENKDTQLTCTNKTSGKELKALYAELNSLSLKNFKLRFLFKGQEILDDHLLYYHNIMNNSKLQVSIADLSKY